MAVPHDAAIGEAHPRTPNTGLGVALAAGLEVAAEPLELVGDFVQADLQIHPLLGTEILGAECLPGHVAESLAEGIELARGEW